MCFLFTPKLALDSWYLASLMVKSSFLLLAVMNFAKELNLDYASLVGFNPGIHLLN